MSDLAGIIVAGGRGSRMGGVTKPLLDLGGKTLLARTVDAARTVGCEEIVIAGPDDDGTAEMHVREQPPFGGPVAGLAAAVTAIDQPWVLVLPGDLVSPLAAARTLVSASRTGDGAFLTDAEGRAQWLTGLYRTAALRERIAAFPGGVRGLAMRALLETLALERIGADTDATADVDTWEHLREARRRVHAGTEALVAESSSRTLPPEALDDWAAALRERFDLAEADLPIALILDLARDVANGVARPAAPFSAFVAGLVAGRAGGSPEEVREAVAEISRLAAEWSNR